MLKTTIQNQIKDAMRAKQSQILETLRYLLSEIKYVEIDKRRELTDEEIIDVLSREVKKRDDAVALFRSSGRLELVKEEEEKLLVIKALLPEQMSRLEVEKIVDRVILEVGKGNMGEVMKAVMPKLKGKAEGRMISEVVKQRLQ